MNFEMERRKVNIQVLEDVTVLGQTTKEELLKEHEFYDKAILNLKLVTKLQLIILSLCLMIRKVKKDLLVQLEKLLKQWVLLIHIK